MSKDYTYEAVQAHRCMVLWRTVLSQAIVDSGLVKPGTAYGRGGTAKVKTKASFPSDSHAELERRAAVNFVLGRSINSRIVCELAGVCPRKLRTWALNRLEAITREMEMAA